MKWISGRSASTQGRLRPPQAKIWPESKLPGDRCLPTQNCQNFGTDVRLRLLRFDNYIHAAETSFAKTPSTKKTRQPHWKIEQEYRRGGDSDYECNDSGDTDSRGGLEWKAVHISLTFYCWIRPRTWTLPCCLCLWSRSSVIWCWGTHNNKYTASEEL